ncbi:MAG: DNA polymerase III subunit delta' C-terminal domain-containing protein [Eubacteriales bacterium]
MDFQSMNLNSKLKRSLSETVDAGKLPHAIILEGGSSAARIKLARLLAATLLCSSLGERPCMTCSACIKAFGSWLNNKKYVGEKLLSEKLNHPEVSEITKEANKVQFGINPIRVMRSEAYIVPNEADVKVYILSDAHLLNVQAQNAFLKILEEPPSYIYFILECTSKSIFLPTVLSRAVVFNLGQIEQGEGATSKKIEKAKTAATDMAIAIMAPKDYELLKCVAIFEKDKALVKLCLPMLELIFRDALVMKLGNCEPLSGSPEIAQELAQKFSSEKLIKLIDETRKLLEAAERSTNHNLLITLMCSRLRV